MSQSTTDTDDGEVSQSGAVETVPISDIQFVEDDYPRVAQDDDVIKRYRDALNELPPITINEDGVLVDGYHRLTAHRAEGETEIRAERVELNGTPVLVEAARRNATHGHQLHDTEKENLARQWYRDNDLVQEEISDVLSVAQSTVSGWCSDIDQERREERQEESPQLYLDFLNYSNQQSVADEFGVTQRAISNDLRKIIESDNISNPPESVKWDNVWRFNTVKEKYGMDWPGRIPGQIVENLLWHYTEPFDLVVDPMAGGGTTVDVCKAMYRRYAAFDINPVEGKDINQHDTVTDGIPIDNGRANLVFIDPPYWRLMDDDYADGGISGLSHEGWIDAMTDLLSEAERVTQSGGHVALLIEPIYDDKDTDEFQDLTFQLANQAQSEIPDFKQEQRVSAPMTHGMKSSRDVEHAKENGYLLDLNRDLIIWSVS